MESHKLEVYRKPHRIRKLMHAVLPSVVAPPEPIQPGKLRHGDRIIHVWPNGEKHSMRIANSIEGPRFAYTSNSLPTADSSADELTVRNAFAAKPNLIPEQSFEHPDTE